MIESNIFFLVMPTFKCIPTRQNTVSSKIICQFEGFSYTPQGYNKWKKHPTKEAEVSILLPFLLQQYLLLFF